MKLPTIFLLLTGAAGLLALGAHAQIPDVLLSVVAASQPTFPYCQCVHDVEPNGPYMMTSFRQVNLAKEKKFCWRVRTVPTSGDSKCSKFDLRKIEMDIEPACRGAVLGATFGGANVSVSFQPYTNPSSMTFKVLRPGSAALASYSYLAGRSTRLCVRVRKGACASLPTFCAGGQCKYAFFDPSGKCCPGQPSAPPPPPPNPATPPPPTPLQPSEEVPPPPPPTTPFPYCCSPGNSNPYNLTPTTTTLLPDGCTTYCYALATAASPASNLPCASFNLRKIELDMAAGCQMAVQRFSFNGTVLEPSYQRYAQGQVAKITRGSADLASYAALKGTTVPVCITLKPGLCPTPAQFCSGGVCKASFFRGDNACCPVQALA